MTPREGPPRRPRPGPPRRPGPPPARRPRPTTGRAARPGEPPRPATGRAARPSERAPTRPTKRPGPTPAELARRVARLEQLQVAREAEGPSAVVVERIAAAVVARIVEGGLLAEPVEAAAERAAEALKGELLATLEARLAEVPPDAAAAPAAPAADGDGGVDRDPAQRRRLKSLAKSLVDERLAAMMPSFKDRLERQTLEAVWGQMAEYGWRAFPERIQRELHLEVQQAVAEAAEGDGTDPPAPQA